MDTVSETHGRCGKNRRNNRGHLQNRPAEFLVEFPDELIRGTPLVNGSLPKITEITNPSF